MDISKLSHGASGHRRHDRLPDRLHLQLAGGRVRGDRLCGSGHVERVGVLAGLIAIALLVWEAIRLANINVALPVTPAMTSAALAILL